MTAKIIKIGRSTGNDIVLKDTSVSRFHCQLFIDDSNNIFLTDLKSSNGTYVNGIRINDSVQLNQNDILKCGFSDPVPWRNYISNIDNISTNQQRPLNFQEQSGGEIQPKKSNSGLKVVFITLTICSVLIGLFYFFNEISVLDIKPSVIDPEKPNNTDSQPEPLKNESKEISYDYSCLNDEDDMGTTDVINIFEEIDNEVTNAIGGEVSIAEEEEVGNDLYRECKSEFIFVESGSQIKNLRGILKLLVNQIKDPKGFHYSIYLIKSDELNAFTAGAKIFVTTKMYNFCQSNDELACVIGHEINHNELGHIKQHIQKNNILGEEGAIISSLLTIPFGQKKETNCDLKGIDLVISAGYNGCVNVSLWKRMQQESNEGDYNAFENLFRSHPYSSKRSICSKNHIMNNYGFDCETKD